MNKEVKHEKRYVAHPSGGGKIVCTCGQYETPVVNDGDAFTLGRRVKTVEQYFGEHLTDVRLGPETTMVEPAAEQAVTPAQHAQPRKRKEQR